jgi:4-alpha-glucanotransferase
MNIPSQAKGNWRWRFGPDLLRPELAEKLAVLTEVSDRLPQPMAPIADEEWVA